MPIDMIREVLFNIADDLHLKCRVDNWYGPHEILARFTDTAGRTMLRCIDIFEFDEYMANKIRDSLMDELNINKQETKQDTTGWRPISEYSRDKYDWVLVKYFDGSYECIPEVAEMRVDGKWYGRSGAEIPDIFDVRYFFDMQQLDKKGETK